MPNVARVKQNLPADHIENVRAETRNRLRAVGLQQKIKPGDQIAVTAGSRGIGGFVDLLNGIVDAVREAGGNPFIIPAMGSHGGATPEGQTEILRLLGVEQHVAAPIRATMETIPLGKSENGAVAHLDKNAAMADGIIVLGRTKTHPESAEHLASGLLKMVTVGLGKRIGAQEAHTHGLWDSIRTVPRVTMAHAKIIFGVAAVENGYRQPVEIEVVQPTYDAFLDSDHRLLHVARRYLAKVPFDHLDVLVMDEFGKTVSGSGMDPNVIGTWRVKREGPRIPDYRRIVALSLTKPSLGNGLGVGLADFITQRIVDDYDPGTTYLNLLTASEPGGNTGEGPVPLALPSDREAIEVALFSSLAGDSPRLCRIKNTAMLGQFWVSEGLLKDVGENPRLDILEKPAPMAFDERGNLQLA